MKKGLNIRIYPTVKQTKAIETAFGCARFVYNRVLAMKKELWEDYRLSYNPNIKSFKEEWSFLTEVSSQVICNSYRDCLTAFNNFFKYQQDYPNFKKKGKCKDSFRIGCTYPNKLKEPNTGDIRIIDRNHIKIPTLGIIQFANYNDNIDWNTIHINNVTISKSKKGHYYASICVEMNDPEYIKPKNNAIAFDLGIKDFAIFNDGTVIENPKFYKKTKNKLANEQRLLSKMKGGSKNYNKQKNKIAKINEKIKNQRKDFHHKISTKIVNENQVIISEDLNVIGMLKNHKLAQSIQDAAFSSFCNMIKYKSENQKRTYIKVDTFFSSSKLCHHCGFKYKGLKLDERFWTCPKCHNHLDRDENAAINILNQGLKMLKYPNGTGESLGKYTSKSIDTVNVNSLEWKTHKSSK